MKLRDSLDCKQGAVRAIRYNIDGDYILTCGSNKTVKLWNATTFVSSPNYLYLCKDSYRNGRNTPH